MIIKLACAKKLLQKYTISFINKMTFYSYCFIVNAMHIQITFQVL